jgi:hypothetical protein
MRINNISFKQESQQVKQKNEISQITTPQTQNNDNKLLLVLGGLAIGAAAGVLIHKKIKAKGIEDEVSKKLTEEGDKLDKQIEANKKKLAELDERLKDVFNKNKVLEAEIEINKRAAKNGFTELLNKYDIGDKLNEFLYKKMPEKKLGIGELEPKAIILKGDNLEEAHHFSKLMAESLDSQFENLTYAYRNDPNMTMSNISKFQKEKQNKHTFVFISDYDKFLADKDDRMVYGVNSEIKKIIENAPQNNITVIIPTKDEGDLNVRLLQYYDIVLDLHQSKK